MYDKDLLVLYILEILSEYANEDKKIYQQDILNLLERNYNIEVTRKTLRKRIASLRYCGYVEGERGIYKKNKYKDDELSILIDSILFAPYIRADEETAIIEKLKSLATVSLKNKNRNIH